MCEIRPSPMPPAPKMRDGVPLAIVAKDICKLQCYSFRGALWSLYVSTVCGVPRSGLCLLIYKQRADSLEIQHDDLSYESSRLKPL